MKKTVSADEFVRSFMEVRPDNFSKMGLYALFEYFDELEQETGEEIELDVIAICCEYSEYKSAREAAEEYHGAVEENKDFDDEDKEKASIAWLQDQTQVIEIEGGGVITQQF